MRFLQQLSQVPELQGQFLFLLRPQRDRLRPAQSGVVNLPLERHAARARDAVQLQEPQVEPNLAQVRCLAGAALLGLVQHSITQHRPVNAAGERRAVRGGGVQVQVLFAAAVGGLIQEPPQRHVL